MPRYQFIIAKTSRGITFLIQFYLFEMDSCLIMSIISTYMHFLQKKKQTKKCIQFFTGIDCSWSCSTKFYISEIPFNSSVFSSQHITYGADLPTSVPLQSLLILFEQEPFGRFSQ